MAHALRRAPSARPAGPADGRLDFLDALRGCAALAVVFQHTAQSLWLGYRTFAFSIFDLGNFGVVLFFLCSGFIIPVSLERQASLSGFWLRRLFRLFPLYWSCLAFTLTMGYLNGWAGFDADFRAQPWACGLANLTMLQTLFGCSNLLGPAWSLMFEIIFYVIVSIQFRLGLIKQAVPLAVGMLLGAIVVEGLAPLAWSIQLPNGILSFFGTMFVGTVLYRYASGELGLRALAGVLALAIFAEVATLAGDAFTDGGVWVHWITARLLAYLVFIVALSLRRRQVPRALSWLGLISYSLYLVHPYVIYQPARALPPWLALFAAPAALIPVAALTYRVIEEPAIRLGRRLTPSRRVARPQQPASPIGAARVEAAGLQEPGGAD
jgi:peptidoglycan/LPS O-acetylase OafA/YrhL